MASGFDRIDYVKWVQRALNRIMGRSLPVDGKEIGPWHGALGDFKEYLRINEPGLDKFQIGARTQNELIRLSHLSPTYAQWLHTKLPGAGDWQGADGAARRSRWIPRFRTTRTSRVSRSLCGFPRAFA